MKSWKTWVVGIIIFFVVMGISLLIDYIIPETLQSIVRGLIDSGIVWGLLICCVVGYAAFHAICPKKKRGQPANRITAVVVLLVYSLTVLAAIFMPSHEFSLKLFLLEGVLVGTITMGIIYGIAQAIQWGIKGKPM